MKKFYPLVIGVFFLNTLVQAQLTLVKPVNLYSYLYPVGNKLLFFGNDDVNNNYELWASDGTTAGTNLLQEIDPGPSGSIIPQVNWDGGTGSYRPIVMNNVLYFEASSPLVNCGLWRSDGTAAGTYNVNSTITFNYSGPFYYPYFCQMGNILYFSAATVAGGDFELYRSDGTNAGTYRVKNISPTYHSDPANLIVYKNTLYLQAFNETTGSELWKSDGTDAGTTLVKDYYTGLQRGIFDANSVGSKLFPWFTVSGNYLYFIGNSASNGGIDQRLYRTDGTDAGTIQLAPDLIPQELTDVNGTLFFFAFNVTNNASGLYKSDGTPAGTVPIPVNNNIVEFPGANKVNSTWHAFKNKLYFIGAQQPVPGNNIHLGVYESDGTTAGTILVNEIPLHDEATRNTDFVNDGTGASFLWRSLVNVTSAGSDTRVIQMDGTPNNYQIYYGADLDPGATLFNNDLYFKGRDTISGSGLSGLYKVHPTLASTPLPLTWLSFDATLDAQKEVDLHWQTASESNNKGFNVERSPDGKNYSSLYWIDGAGTSTSTRTYAWTDLHPADGTNYYRIQQVDFDGKSSYSPTKEIDLISNAPLIITPNPVTGNTMTIRHHLPPGKVLVKITDLAGKVILKQEYTLSGSTLSCDIRTVRTGEYFMEITGGSKILGSGLFVKF